MEAREVATALPVVAGLVLPRARAVVRESVGAGARVGRSSPASRSRCSRCSTGASSPPRRDGHRVWQNLWAAVVLLPIVAWTGPEGAIGARDIALMLVLGLVCTALAHTLFIAALAGVTAHTAATIAALEPVYGIALAALLLGEIPGPRTLVGGTLIVGAAIAASRRADIGAAQGNR